MLLLDKYLCDPGREPAAEANVSDRPRVLVVEDEPSISLLLERLLENCALEVVSAHSGFEAVEACRKEKIDLILMDVRMPGMNGYETSDLIWETQAEHCGVPIIAMTAATCNSDFRTHGIDKCLEKPLDSFVLYQTINDRLGSVCRI